MVYMYIIIINQGTGFQETNIVDGCIIIIIIYLGLLQNVMWPGRGGEKESE